MLSTIKYYLRKGIKLNKATSGQNVSSMLLLKRRGQLWIAPERMKQLDKKCKSHSVEDESKVWCCKEQNWIGTCNVRSMKRGKLDEGKQEMTPVNIDILEISELKGMGMGKFNSDDHYIP